MMRIINSRFHELKNEKAAQERRRRLEEYLHAKTDNNVEALDKYEALFQAYVGYYNAARRARGFLRQKAYSFPSRVMGRKPMRFMAI
jgi:hypothetical protein